MDKDLQMKLQRAYDNGMRAIAAKQVDKAYAIFQAVLKAAPSHGPTHLQMGMIENARKNGLTALNHFAVAAKLMPREPVVWTKYGAALLNENRDAEALKALGKAERLNPNSYPTISCLIQAHQRSGDFKKAKVYLRKALKQRPHDGRLYRLLSMSHTFSEGDEQLSKMLSVNPDALEDDLSRAQLEFGLAKAFEDIGQYAKSFEYLQKANARAKTAYPYDPQARTRSIQSYQAAQSDVDYTVPLPDAVEDAPIFVTGMPRSGTTLIEQIIAAHSNVTSLGETGFMRTRVQRLLQNGKTFHHLNDVSDKLRKVVAEGYLSDVAIRAPKAQRTVDKSIGTYLCLGVVKQIMPNAKFIIVRRDPRDTLLSIYRNFFDQGTHRYAYDFDTLAHEYASFVDMVEFWKTKMPEAIYEADYDALVADPEPQSRALIAAAGLDWEDRCLDFHKSKTSVKTLSLAQVRQPIYKSSQKAWQRYGDAINPLLDALEKRGIHVPD